MVQLVKPNYPIINTYEENVFTLYYTLFRLEGDVLHNNYRRFIEKPNFGHHGRRLYRWINML